MTIRLHLQADERLSEPVSAQSPDTLMQPLRALHLDSMYPDGISHLSEPFQLFHFDFSAPPGPDGARCDCQVRALWRLTMLPV